MNTITELYYKPAPNNMGPGATLAVTDDMIQEVADAQRAMAAAQGYLPVTNYTPAPELPGFFGLYQPTYARTNDGEGYLITWTFRARPVRLSQAKILADEAIAPLLPTLAPALAQDEQLAKWWTSNMTYLRGSPMAARAMEVLNVTQEQLEAIARRCAI